MTFWEHFLRLLLHRPKAAIAALYWYVTKRKVRAHNRLRVASAGLPFVYAAWIAANENTSELVDNCAAALQEWGWQPRFSIALYSCGYGSDEWLERSMRSVEQQVYPHWSVAGRFEDPIETAIAAANGDFVVPLCLGDELSSGALFRFAEAARANPGAQIFYGDEDQIDEHGRRTRPWFKPQWNEEMFLALDYLSSCAAIERRHAFQASTRLRSSDISSLMLAATSAADGAIIHVPHILCHRCPTRLDEGGRLAAVASHVHALGASCRAGRFETIKVNWPLPEALPLVSIIIPTRDKLELLRPCVESVLTRTNYPRFELLIVDNDSIDSRTATYLAEVQARPNVDVLEHHGPFNFSAITNLAASHVSGSFLCLLNNDTEVIDPEWLTELMRYAVRPNVGAAGAKLLYEDGTIQHAGIIIGIGEAAGHAHRSLPDHEPGYFSMAHVPQYVSAVTAACLIIEKRKFEAVGGFDEKLAVAFNDVDFCLKVQAAGWRNVYVPQAILLHHESRSRGRDISPQNKSRFRGEMEILQNRWSTKTYKDPVHNPNLDRCNETFIIAL